MCRGARVGVTVSPTALGEPRCHALVVKLHRYRNSPLETLRKRSRAPGLLALRSGERKRQADDDSLRARFLGQPRQRRQAVLRVASGPDGSESAAPQRADP